MRASSPAQGDLVKPDNHEVATIHSRPWIRTALVAVIAIASVWFTNRCHGFPDIGIDDANIFFTYAHHIIEGNGFVYNKGDERVEGFTSLTWVLLCATLFRLGFHELSVLVTCITLLIITQLLLLAIIKKETVRMPAMAWPCTLLYLALVFSSPSYVTWMSITLMDTCLWGAAMACGLFLVLYPPASRFLKAATVLFFSVLPVIRPEGMAMGPLLLLLFWRRMQAHERSDAGRMALSCGLAFTGTLVAVTLFRLHYFGYPLPNTFYAKVSPSLLHNLTLGKTYLKAFMHSSPIVSIGILSAALVLAGRAACIVRSLFRKNRGSALTTLDLTAMVAMTLIALPVLTGGDHFALFRFFQPAYPLLCLLLTLWMLRINIPEIIAWYRESRHFFFSAVTLLFVSIPAACWLWSCSHDCSWSSLRREQPIAVEFYVSNKGVQQGALLYELFKDVEPLPTIGVITAGAIKRTYPGKVQDLMGLNNTMMAHATARKTGIKNHAAFDTGIFFRLKPDILLAELPASPDTENFFSLCLNGVYRNRTFQTMYSYGTFRDTSSSRQVRVFLNNTFLETVRTSVSGIFTHDPAWARYRATGLDSEGPPVEAGKKE
ncbi:MAG: hypothetical protein JXA71_02710 [Chitinispirillaceae bacterium]|nr:hypothetical protein [Chitinispirillaceae bacterium]